MVRTILALAPQYLMAAFVSRLSNAATLYQLVRSVGMSKTKVVVSGRDPPGYRRPNYAAETAGWPFSQDTSVFNGTAGE